MIYRSSIGAIALVGALCVTMADAWANLTSNAVK